MVAVTGTPADGVVDENCTVIPVGAPLALNVTGALNPPCAISVIFIVADPPGATDSVVTLGVTVKFN